MRASIAAVIGSWLLLASTAAHADKIAIIGIEVVGDAAPELSAQLARSTATGLEAEGAQVVSLEDVRVSLRSSQELIGCASTACLQRVGELVGASRFVRAKMESIGAAYTVELILMSAGEGDGVVKRIEDTCTACTVTELNELATKTAARLLSEPARSAVVIATVPPGANVLVDGESVGESPYTGTLAPGDHTVVARLDGYGVGEKQIKVLAGTPEAQDFVLSLPPSAAIGDEPERTRSYKLWKWVAAGGAVVWIGTGIALVAIDGNQTCDGELVSVPGSDPVRRQCPDLYDTRLTGVLSLGVGLGLGALSGYMFYKDHQAAEAGPSANLSATRGGGIATLRWKF